MKRTTLQQQGTVKLQQVDSKQGVRMYWVCYPAKFNKGVETQQFLVRKEAEHCYKQFAAFFNR